MALSRIEVSYGMISEDKLSVSCTLLGAIGAILHLNGLRFVVKKFLEHELLAISPS